MHIEIMKRKFEYLLRYVSQRLAKPYVRLDIFGHLSSEAAIVSHTHGRLAVINPQPICLQCF